ncbi:MAG: 4'-phosphopantetheinyl transferase superfamily protein [Clostridia bacterium]|nr:4'-phosphopantetheinyl transferase superfamily protein [Clostridia bacterium]
MLIVEWAPVSKTELIPPFGDALIDHIGQYRNPTVKYTSCSAWGLLYRMMKQNGLEGGTVVFEKNGKPRFADDRFFFSISHSRDVCAAAIADVPVGVDVEVCRANYNARLVERSLTVAEKALFDGDFTRFWCRKEAVAKMTGRGITGYPSDIDTVADGICYEEKKLEYQGAFFWLVSARESTN